MEWTLPELGEGVQEGEVVKWMIKEGDPIKIDQTLLQIMTDKATMELPSSLNGTIKNLRVKEGDIISVGDTLATIETGAGEAKEASKETKAESGEAEQSPKESKKTEPKREEKREPEEGKKSDDSKSLASPAVRQLARDKGVELSSIEGSGPGGRILKDDVLNADTGEKAAPPRATSKQSGPREERVPLRGIRRKIAEHMVHSRQTAAHFTHIDEADFTTLMALRKRLKPASEEQGAKLTFLPFIMKAVVQGLKAYPQVNVAIDDDKQEIIYKKYFNISLAVATEKGLIVPVVKDVDQKSIIELAKEIQRLGEAAREGKIALEDLKGGCMSLTNIGTIGGIMSAPIINYPESFIMGLHEIKKRPMVVNSEVAIRDMMYITISADHRVIDGADIAAFLNTVIDHIEDPELLLLNAI